MIEFYIKVPEEKENFFTQLMNDLGYEYEKLFSSNNEESDIEIDEDYFTDSEN